jgi:hypothetical protein
MGMMRRALTTIRNRHSLPFAWRVKPEQNIFMLGRFGERIARWYTMKEFPVTGQF